jgi:hypothetical protein
VEAVNAQARATAEQLTGGFLIFMTGEQPESADEEVPEELTLARCQFSTFAPPKDGVLQSNPLTKSIAIRTGEPTWCRCVTRDGRTVMDGSVGRQDANAITKVAMLVQGQIVNVTEFKHIISRQGQE